MSVDVFCIDFVDFVGVLYIDVVKDVNWLVGDEIIVDNVNLVVGYWCIW